jgi:hypothetical protein
MTRHACVMLVSLFPAVSVAQFQRDTIYLQALDDAMLYEDNLGILANGAGQHLLVGRTDFPEGNLITRPIIRFDIAGSIPSNAYISEAELTLHASKVPADSQFIAIHQLTSMWTEGSSDPPAGEEYGAPADTGDVTWLHCSFPFNFWTMPGGDFSIFRADTQWVTDTGLYTWNSMYMPAAVQDWLDTPSVNFGWVLTGDESTAGSAVRFDSRENPVPEFRPELMVVYVTHQWDTIPVLYDNVLYEDSAGAVSNGQGDYLWVGRTDDSIYSLRRSIVMFDIASVIPSGAAVFDVRLTLHLDSSVGGPTVVMIQDIQGSAGEGASMATGNELYGAPAQADDATWLHRFSPSTDWPTPGGEFDPFVSATILMDSTPGPYVFWEFEMLNDVGEWAFTGQDNAGWIIKTSESTAGQLKRFGSRSNSDPLLSPVLEVAWSQGCLIQIPGDVNVSGALTSADIIYLVMHVFKGLDCPQPCCANGDVNCSGAVTSGDIIYMVNRVFKGGPEPCDICNDSPMPCTP